MSRLAIAAEEAGRPAVDGPVAAPADLLPGPALDSTEAEMELAGTKAEKADRWSACSEAGEDSFRGEEEEEVGEAMAADEAEAEG